MMGLKVLLFMFSFMFLSSAFQAGAQTCPGVEDDPAVTAVTRTGPRLIVCGFEDSEVPAKKPKRAFTDFAIYYNTHKSPQLQNIFASETADTYWVKAVDGKAIELEELWFFSEKPMPALKREVTCDAE